MHSRNFLSVTQISMSIINETGVKNNTNICKFLVSFQENSKLHNSMAGMYSKAYLEHRPVLQYVQHNSILLNMIAQQSLEVCLTYIQLKGIRFAYI